MNYKCDVTGNVFEALGFFDFFNLNIREFQDILGNVLKF